MKLNIQLFAENYVDTESLRNIGEQLKSLSNSIVDDFESAANDLLTVWTERGWTSEMTAESMSKTINGSKADFEELRTNLIALAEHLGKVSTNYEQIDTKISNELNAWADTFIASINKLKNGAHSTVAKGSYPVNSFITDMSTSTRNIVNEAFTMIENTGHFYKSTTGYSFAETTGKLIGSIKTLFTSSAEGGIFSKFVNQLVGTSM